MKNTRKSNAIDLGEFKGAETNTNGNINHTDKLIRAWVDKSDGKIYIEPIPNQGHVLAVMVKRNDPENYRRLVACWNFCAGFTTSQIESSSLKNQIEKERKLAGELGKKWGNENDATITCRAIERDLALDNLKRLIVAARTSGGTAGPDQGLMDACTEAERIISVIKAPAYFIATENGITDIDTPPSDN